MVQRHVSLQASLVFIFLAVSTITERHHSSVNALFATRQPRSTKRPQFTNSQSLIKSNRYDNNRRSVCLNYADEWVDADVNLAFSTGGVAATRKSKRSNNYQNRQKGIRKRIANNISRVWYRIKESIRTKVEKSTVYVLECEGGKYYVGSTQNFQRRLSEHKRGRGSKWTRRHKPVRVLRRHKRIPTKFLLGMESKVTAECMLEFGVNNVRGSYFCSPRDYHVGDVDVLTKFLGHYCDLNYRKVNSRLLQILPETPGKSYRRKSAAPKRCYVCGKTGHKASNCPERSPDSM